MSDGKVCLREHPGIKPGSSKDTEDIKDRQAAFMDLEDECDKKLAIEVCYSAYFT